MREGLRSATDELTPGEVEILVAGLSDEIALVWALFALGIRTNGAEPSGPPSAAELGSAFASFQRLVVGGYMRIGATEFMPGGVPDGVRPAPYRHVSQPLDDVRRRVDRDCRQAKNHDDWAFSCWLVNTEKGARAAREALDARHQDH